MTLKQQVFSLFYPWVRIFANRIHAAGKVLKNTEAIIPAKPFYTLSGLLLDGSPFSFETLRGKKVLIVNTASHCGYTPQYKELERIFRARKDKMIILGFPSNDFKGQEPGTDDEIAGFCKANYGISFPLFKKDRVTMPNPQEVYRWLTDKRQNGWNERPPLWNFSKYLIDEQGILQAVYGPEVSVSDIGL